MESGSVRCKSTPGGALPRPLAVYSEKDLNERDKICGGLGCLDLRESQIDQLIHLRVDAIE